MIPESIQQYLTDHQIKFRQIDHPRAVSAQETAHVVHQSGRRLCKCVIVRADDKLCMAVAPASMNVDLMRLKEVMGAKQIRLATEDEFKDLFPDCELGAEPPFGGLYNIPVVLDESLQHNDRVLVRGGSHDLLLEMSMADFGKLEWPKIADICSPTGAQA